MNLTETACVFFIIKRSRSFSGNGYAGISCEKAGVESGATYKELQDAISDAGKLAKVNLVGWQVVDGSGDVQWKSWEVNNDDI